jgi:hypothetical protein
VSATDTRAAMPSPQELGELEAFVYVAFEKVEELAWRVSRAEDESQGASPEECWHLHFIMHNIVSWADSLVEKAKEIQAGAITLSLADADSGMLPDVYGTTPGNIQDAIERLIARRRKEDEAKKEDEPSD